MATFLQYLHYSYGEQPQQAAAAIMDGLGLPDAQFGAYMAGTNNATLFINDLGLTLRAGHALRCPEHDLILRPLRSLKFDNRHRESRPIAVELLPGIRGVLKSETETEGLAAALAEDDIWYTDNSEANGGYLPPSADFPAGLPVVLDRGGVTSNASIKACFLPLNEVFRRAAYSGLQERLYEPLNTALKACWPQDTLLPSHGALTPFAALCRAEIQKYQRGQPSLLANAWDQNCRETYYSKPNQVSDIAATYHQQRRAASALQM